MLTRDNSAAHIEETYWLLNLPVYINLAILNPLKMSENQLHCIIEAGKGKSRKEVEKRVRDLQEFVREKDIPVPIFMSERDEVKLEIGTLSILETLGLGCEEHLASGQKIEVSSDTPFTELLRRYSNSLEYHVCFSKYPGTSIGKAKSKNAAIGFYTREFVILPGLTEYNDINEDSFLNELYQICKRLRKEEASIGVPSWADQYYLPGESEDRVKLNKIVASIANLEKERIETEKKIANYMPLKHLWTASGLVLEKAVKAVFEELGFCLLETKSGRDDLIMQWKDSIIIVEVKGVSKSAAEKNAAQLEKWVSTYRSENDAVPKGLLIVNTFREFPIDKRTQSSFPVQMIPYSKSREHCLCTTLQLCCLLLFVRKNPKSKNSMIRKLIETTGVYPDFNDWKEFISVEP